MNSTKMQHLLSIDRRPTKKLDAVAAFVLQRLTRLHGYIYKAQTVDSTWPPTSVVILLQFEVWCSLFATFLASFCILSSPTLYHHWRDAYIFWASTWLWQSQTSFQMVFGSFWCVSFGCWFLSRFMQIHVQNSGESEVEMGDKLRHSFDSSIPA